ncbi:NEQ478 [Nanoarchaeum equitans Kin4-M]|uniref:Small ribosomal subunit protein eS4 n=1 Tax=Nanoarchaeum equitans (strain Kin4-M) TaxID=228908 RepID=RS4E_NANEQ|nr:RecName: Full=Small ribosomal subunit protein eS4; AltName: Full=30S ribosomal protein S4e [Nanoarchaeum equitans Kin4-M]AAR39321.1 NEQ478 [Nanoarchaeum equitans Kin4-M]
MPTYIKRHLRSLAVPRTWPVPRKSRGYWIVKPSPGPHSKEFAMPIAVWLRDYLGLAENMREVRYLLNNGKVLVDGRPIKDYKFPVGLFDVLAIPEINEYYRVLLDERGKLYLKKIDKEEANIKYGKIIRKVSVRGGKIQYTLTDGRTFLGDNSYKTHYGVVYEIPNFKIREVIPLEKDRKAYIIRGKHTGRIGVIKEVIKTDMPWPNIVRLEVAGEVGETWLDNIIPVPENFEA